MGLSKRRKRLSGKKTLGLDEDGDITLVSSDDIEFKVHSFFLMATRYANLGSLYMGAGADPTQPSLPRHA